MLNRFSRRVACVGFASALLSLVGLARSADAAPCTTQGCCGNMSCRNNPARCRDGCVCCVYDNGNSRCLVATAVCAGEVVAP